MPCLKLSKLDLESSHLICPFVFQKIPSSLSVSCYRLLSHFSREWDTLPMRQSSEDSMETIHSFRLVSSKLLVHHGLISNLRGLATISRYSMSPAFLSSTHPDLPVPHFVLSSHLSHSHCWKIAVNRLLLTFYFIIISFTWNNFLL